MKFADMPPADRWLLLDQHLPQIIAAYVKTADVDPTDEVALAELAEKHGVSQRKMIKRLRTLGGSPYRLGTRWFIRRRSLVTALETAEKETL